MDELLAMNIAKATKQKVLIADDERSNRKVLADILQADYTVILAKNGQQVMERAIQHRPDLILLDIIMPEQNGYEIICDLKAHAVTSSIPVIFISALDSVDDEEKGLLLGASDYITKPFRHTLVKARIDNHMQMVCQRKLLEDLVNLDGLTNIANRRCFEEALLTEWQRAQRSGLPISLAMIDVDHFKQYNDNYGHGGGDSVLRIVAKTLRNNLNRPSDNVARYGGEEFVVLLPDTDQTGAAQLLNELRAKIEKLVIPHAFSPTSQYITVSAGGATLIAERESDAFSLVELADNSLYKAKNQGRNQVIWS
ncbi:GGDEF domain-containing response regulator [Oleiphilus messinensis]|nr:diguanylate cyclase [Oleiphilus messinensis]